MLNFTEDENSVKTDITFNSKDINKSSQSYDNVLSSLSLYYQVYLDELLLFPSKKSLIHSFFRYIHTSFDIRNIYIYAPITKEYKEIAYLYDFNIILINIYEDININIPKSSLVIFANPNLLDGKYHNLEELFTLWNKNNAVVFIDETFLPYTSKSSTNKYLNITQNLFILKSLNKFYSNKSIKLSTLLSSKINIKNISLYESKDSISLYDIYFTNSFLKEKNFKVISKAINSKNKNILELILSTKKVFEYYIPSDTNFILVKVLDKEIDCFYEFLTQNSIRLEECSSYDFLSKAMFRIVIKNQEKLEKLSKALESF